MTADDEVKNPLEEQLNQAMRKLETLTDVFLEHLTNFDNRLESTLQQLDATMNARIEARVQDELARLGLLPSTEEVHEGD